MVANVLLGLIVCGAIIAILRIRYKEDEARLAAFQARAEAELRKVHINSSDLHLILDAATAEVMDDKPEGISNGKYLIGYSVNRIVRNASGEYFWLRYDSVNDHKVVTKHMEHKLAKTLLQEKYIAP